MGLDVFFKEDIGRSLRAAELASKATARAMESNGVSGPEVNRYRQGYQDALAVVAASFGLDEPETYQVRSLATRARRQAMSYG